MIEFQYQRIRLPTVSAGVVFEVIEDLLLPCVATKSAVVGITRRRA